MQNWENFFERKYNTNSIVLNAIRIQKEKPLPI